MVELVEAVLALLDCTGERPSKSLKKKALAKAKEAAKETLAKPHEIKSETNKAEEATKVTNDLMKAGFQVDAEKAMKTVGDAKGAMTAAASQIFTFYSNLLSPKSNYLWNKIVSEQTESNLFVNLQGVSLEGPRPKGNVSQVVYQLHDVSPAHCISINTAEQEKYYITNVLKKPQHVKYVIL